MREATIKVWVLTGDKIETAINIGFSSGLLDNEIVQIHIVKTNETLINEEIQDGLIELKKVQRGESNSKLALIVSGESLLYIMNNPSLK
jgi:magnesium-transporting ATPase (P-type)